jgi:hypothetical protein
MRPGRDRSCSRPPDQGILCPVTRTPTVANYRHDPLYGRIAKAVDDILRRGKIVLPVEVLVRMSLLTRQHLEDWRSGRVPYLERVTKCNLVRLTRVLRILRFHAHDLNLKPSLTAYIRCGSGPKQHLQFTKTRDAKLEVAYATHFVWPGKRPFHFQVSSMTETAAEQALRLGRIGTMAAGLMGSAEQGRHYCERLTNFALGGTTPLKLLKTAEGEQWVLAELQAQADGGPV